MRTWIKVIIIIVVLTVIVFPKPVGKSGSGMPPPTTEYSWIEKDCSCIGYKFDATSDLMDAPHSYFCIGIPYSCQCTEYTYNRNTNEKFSEQITCQ